MLGNLSFGHALLSRNVCSIRMWFAWSDLRGDFWGNAGFVFSAAGLQLQAFCLISGAGCCRWEVALGKAKAGVLLDISVRAVWYLGNVVIRNQPGFHRQTSSWISMISPVDFCVPILPSGNGCPFLMIH